MRLMRLPFLKLACCTLLAFAASSCSGKKTAATTHAAIAADPEEEVEVTERIHDIYSQVIDLYNRCNGTPQVPSVDERLYCSKAWMANKQAVGRKEKDSTDEMGCFSYDYWIQGQDWHDLSFGNILPVTVTPEKAEATLTVHNMGEDTEVRLSLVKEDGKWMIDNIGDAREAMQENLNNN